MKKLFRYIKRHMALRLSLSLIVIIGVVFTLLFGYLFYRCKTFVSRSAIQRATLSLDHTAEHINGIMDQTETVTNFMAVTAVKHLTPDSLLAYSRRMVLENDFLTGFAISMEPDYFPEMGRYFSAYSLRQGDTVSTVREGPFEYFDAVWYASSRNLGRPCWTGAFDDYNEGTMSCPDIMTSYCCPMRDADGRFIGSLTASLTLKWLSNMVSAVPDYPNSSAIIVDPNGTYLVHPDSTKLFRESIFTDADPRVKNQIDALGRDMIAGRSGMIETTVDNADAFIFYRPLERTGWSIAIVCPASDVFASFKWLFFMVWIVIVTSLLLLLVFCTVTIHTAIRPLESLDSSARRIANGHFDDPLPASNRHDSIGRLTNSFIRMQQSLDKSVRDILRANQKLERGNEKLSQAYELKMEANRQKSAFIQYMYHEIRTPLNIISGFTQVLTVSLHELPADEIEDITTRMEQSANDINRLTQELSEK